MDEEEIDYELGYAERLVGKKEKKKNRGGKRGASGGGPDTNTTVETASGGVAYGGGGGAAAADEASAIQLRSTRRRGFGHRETEAEPVVLNPEDIDTFAVDPRAEPKVILAAFFNKRREFERENKDEYVRLAKEACDTYRKELKETAERARALIQERQRDREEKARRRELKKVAAQAKLHAMPAILASIKTEVDELKRLAPRVDDDEDDDSDYEDDGGGRDLTALLAGFGTDGTDGESMEIEAKIETMFAMGGDMLAVVKDDVEAASRGLPAVKRYEMLVRVHSHINESMLKIHKDQQVEVDRLFYMYRAAEFTPDLVMTPCLLCMFMRWTNGIAADEEAGRRKTDDAYSDCTGTSEDSDDDDRDGDGDSPVGHRWSSKKRRRRVPTATTEGLSTAGGRTALEMLTTGACAAFEGEMKKQLMDARLEIDEALDLKQNGCMELAKSSVASTFNVSVAMLLMTLQHPLWAALRDRCGNMHFTISQADVDRHIREDMDPSHPASLRVRKQDVASLPMEVLRLGMGIKNDITGAIRINPDALKNMTAVQNMVDKVDAAFENASETQRKARLAQEAADIRRLNAQLRIDAARERLANQTTNAKHEDKHAAMIKALLPRGSSLPAKPPSGNPVGKPSEPPSGKKKHKRGPRKRPRSGLEYCA